MKGVSGRVFSPNIQSRFESIERVPVDLEPVNRPKIRIVEEQIQKVLTENTSPDLDFDRTINPYRGCTHACIYCYARPTHSYLDYSPGIDFERIIHVRKNAPRALEGILQKKNFRPRKTVIGAITDPYQPLESRFQITRSILEILENVGHATGIATRSDLILRDLDLLEKMAKKNLVSVALSIPTLDDDLRKTMEPGAPSIQRRFQAMEGLRAAGVPVQVFVAPIIPGLTDQDLEGILERAARSGAKGAHGILLRLPHEVDPLFQSWLERAYPEKKNRVIHALQSMRDGKNYDSRFGHRMNGTGTMARLLFDRFRLARRRWNLDTSLPDLSLDAFRPSCRNNPQLDLFADFMDGGF